MNPPSTLDVIRELNNAGGPAFPTTDIPGGWTGMSLRDYYAGCILTGMSGMGSLTSISIDYALKWAQAMVDEAVKRDYKRQ